MNLIDKINRLVLARSGRTKMHLAVRDDVLLVSGQKFALANLAEIVAYEKDAYVGTVISLTLSFPQGQMVTTTQDEPCSNDLPDCLDRLKLTIKPSRVWLVEIIAGAQHPIVLRARPPA